MTKNDFDRTARLWLEDGPTDMSDRALQAALDEIHVTRQRRAWWPARRISSMPTAIRLAAGVAAIVVVALVGINLISFGNGGVGGRAPVSTPAPTPTLTPSPTPTPTPSPRALLVGQAASLEAGTYTTGDPFLSRVTFTVPAGWYGNLGGPYLADLGRALGTGEVAFSIFDKVYADPCHLDRGLLNPQPGPTVDALATALAKLPVLKGTTPTDVTLGGYHGKQLTLTAPTSVAGCTLAPGGTFRVWELPRGATHDLTPGGRDRVWILDVDGQRLVIDAPEMPGQTAQANAEIQTILDSVRIAPLTGPTPKPS